MAAWEFRVLFAVAHVEVESPGFIVKNKVEGRDVQKVPDIREVVDKLKTKDSYQRRAAESLADKVEVGTPVFYLPSSTSGKKIGGRVVKVNEPDRFHSTTFDIELDDGRVFKMVDPLLFKKRQNRFMLDRGQ